ncbi:short-chain dehydrogenase [Thelonectria olida]|uniref:Short-chain dehydrogenase n=1 Tax=Thelonectria olida TaxID=1576542 RepID=A0A9P8W0Y8_9HYPO|nr:short-chain dehydrogenase [Thelonectria olida]
MSSIHTVLITGATRGIGRGLTTAFLLRPSTTVIAAVRDTTKGPAKALSNLPTGNGSKLILVKIDSAVESDPATAVASLEKDHGIDHLDLVIANAGIGHSGKPVLQNSLDSITEHFAINVGGPVSLIQATAPLLKAKKDGKPLFVALSSLIGSLGGMELLQAFPPLMAPYGGSKTALNWFMRRLHFEEPWLISFVFHPGLVLTDMADATFGDAGVNPKDVGAITVEESVEGMVKVITSATEETGGTFKQYNGETLPW